MDIYVGNLPYEASDEDLWAAFSPFGEVASARVIKDRFSGRSRGFGFVEMSNATEAEAAINDLNGKDMRGRNLTVNQARPRDEAGAGGGGAGGGGGRGPRF